MKAECSHTIREEKKKIDKVPSDKWWDSEESGDEEEFKKKFIEKHYAVLPSIIYSKSHNPDHKLHITCLVNPPLEEHEKKKLKFQEDVLISKLISTGLPKLANPGSQLMKNFRRKLGRG